MQGHYLGHNLNTTTPSSHIVAHVLYQDVPTVSRTHKQELPLRLWSARAFRWYRHDVSRVATRQGEALAPFWDMITSRLDQSRVLWVWLHQAGAALTSLGLWRAMDEGYFSISEPTWRFVERASRNPRCRRRHGFVADADPPTIIHLWHQSGAQVRFVDLRNWFRQGMESLAEEQGCELPERPTASEGLHRERAYSLDCVRLIQETVVGLLDSVHRHDMGVLQATAPAQALSSYRHRFLDNRLVVHKCAEARALERSCYYGGRVEPFFVGLVLRQGSPAPTLAHPGPNCPVLATDGPIFHLDVSSLYPFVMRYQPMPIALNFKPEANVSPGRLTGEGMWRACAEVTVRSPHVPYPRREKDQTVWCTGQFRTHLCGPELLQAWMSGHLLHVHLACAYEMGLCFESYVDYWWNVRRQADASGNRHEERLAKNMLTHLYGKLSQRSRRWTTIEDRSPRQRWGVYAERHPETNVPTLYRGIAGVLQEMHYAENYQTSLPAIGAFVTAHGRRVMDAFRKTAGERNVYYQGVDSLYVNQEGYFKLQEQGSIEPGTLGKLRLVGQADFMRIYGCGDYQFGNRVVRVGLSRVHIDRASGREMQQRIDGLRNLLPRGSDATVCAWAEPVPPHDSAERGVVGADGWVRPFHREEVSDACPF